MLLTKEVQGRLEEVVGKALMGQFEFQAITPRSLDEMRYEGERLLRMNVPDGLEPVRLYLAQSRKDRTTLDLCVLPAREFVEPEPLED